MILSMTGFGKSEISLPKKKIAVEIKSLNSKQLDLSTRVPSIFRSSEIDLRNIVASRLGRGKVDMTVTVENTGTSAPATLNVDVLMAYKQQICAACEKLDIPQPNDWYSVLLRFPDTMHSESPSDPDADETKAIVEATEQALDKLMAYRRAEGEKLETFFTTRIDAIAALLAEIPVYEQERITKIRARIADGLQNLPGVEFDTSRLEQEMIFYIEKLDINEEKQRLAQHLTYFLETMSAPESQGKKLGFIAQEIGREINTLGSKSNHAEMQKIVVKMKDNLEQIKEQVLNAL